MKYIFIVFFCLIFAGNHSVAQQNDQQLLKDIKTLSSDVYKGRKTGTSGNEKARNYIRNRFKEVGITPFNTYAGFVQSFVIKNKTTKTKGLQGTNVLGYIAGNHDSVIVISAHYDHLGTRADGEIYNGADDNASGVAAMLKFAEFFAKNKPNNTLIFVAFDAEEMGLLGAKAFVKNPPITLSKIKLNINMDMISHNDKGELYAAGIFKYPQFQKYCLTTNPKINILFGHDDPKLGHDDWTNQSDQGAFDAVNIPFIYFGVEDHEDYHKVSDEFKNINQTFFIDATNAILEVIKNIDNKRDSKTIFRQRLKM